MKQIFTAATVDEAKNKAAVEFGTEVEKITFTVLEEPKKGFFGKIKGEAKVEAEYEPETKVETVTEKTEAVEEKAEAAAAVADDAPITGPVERAPMGGKVVEVKVKAGDKVKKGDLLLVYEAMKMENELAAEKDAVVKRVFVTVDDVVGTDAPLIEFEA